MAHIQKKNHTCTYDTQCDLKCTKTHLSCPEQMLYSVGYMFSLCSQYPMDLQIQIQNQPIKCLGRRDVSYCASQCVLLAVILRFIYQNIVLTLCMWCFFLYVYEKVPGGGGIFRHHLGHALQTRSFPSGSQQPGGKRASSQRAARRTRTSQWRRVTTSAPDRRADQTVRATRILTPQY